MCKTFLFLFSAINPILYNAMSDKFRKSFRSLLVCGRLNTGRNRSAMAMAATMANDISQAQTSVYRNPHSTYYSGAGDPQIRSRSQSRDQGCVNVTALALVEIPKSNNEGNNSESTSLLASKIDGISSSSSAGSTSSHQNQMSCPRHQKKDR